MGSYKKIMQDDYQFKFINNPVEYLTKSIILKIIITELLKLINFIEKYANKVWRNQKIKIKT